MNQQANGGAWTTLGTWTFNAGATTITVNDQADGYVIADAVRYEPEGALPESANWSPALTTPARYDVHARRTALANRTAQAKYMITHQGGTATVTQNQQANGGTWNLLGTWTFAPGHRVRLEAADDGYAIADAVRFTPAAEQPTPASAARRTRTRASLTYAAWLSQGAGHPHSPWPGSRVVLPRPPAR